MTSIAGSVYDDCVFLFEGGRDGFNGTAADGTVQAGEFVDELRAGMPSHSAHAGYLRGYSENLTWKTMAVPAFQASGMGTQTTRCLHIEHNYRISGTTTNYCTGAVHLPYIPTVCPTNVYSAVIRCRRDVNPYGNNASWLMNFGYTKNTNGQGWLLGFASNGAVTTHATGSSAPGNLTDLPIVATNEWVDLAVSVSTNVVIIQLAKPGTGAYGNDYARVFTTKRTFTSTAAPVPNLTMASWAIRLGTQEDANSANNVTSISPNAKKVFVGDVQKLAFWPRALSESELREALSGPRPAIMQVGAANGASDEFGGTAASEASLDVGHVALKPWSDFPSELRAGDSWTLNFNVEEGDAGMPQMLEFTTLSTSSSGSLRIRLNGAVVASGKAVEAGEKLSLVVPGRLVVSGANTLVIDRTDSGSGSVVMDSLWIGGSWQIGKRNSSPAEFSWHSALAYMTSFDTYSWPRAMNVATGSSNMFVSVTAPAEIVAKYPYRYVVRTWIASHGTTSPTMGVYVDGVKVPLMIDGVEYDEVPTVTTATDVSFDIPAGTHKIKFNGVGTQGVWWLDCHRLVFEPPQAGTMLIVR